MGHLPVVRLLLKLGADVAAKDSDGKTAIDWAVATMKWWWDYMKWWWDYYRIRGLILASLRTVFNAPSFFDISFFCNKKHDDVAFLSSNKKHGFWSQGYQHTRVRIL
jgi:hypothetical protein